MAALTRSYQEKYPLATVSMTIGNQQEGFAAIDSGSCELGLTFDLELPGDYHTELCETFPPKLIVPVDHRLANADKIELR